MTDLGGTWQFGDKPVHRMGYGAMQLAGPGVFGPPKDREGAAAVLQAAVDAGIDHIDTSDFYGPHVVNEVIREALAPYPDDLLLVSKIGARRDSEGGWKPALSPEELRQAVRDNCMRLGVDALHAINLRMMYGETPTEGPVEGLMRPLMEMREEGLVRHIGISNATRRQVDEARDLVDIVCVQNHYNLAHRADDALIDELAADGIAYVPFFPLGGFTPFQSSTLSDVARDLDASVKQVALAWLLRRSPNILLIPGTSSVGHLHENIAAAELDLPAAALEKLDTVAA